MSCAVIILATLAVAALLLVLPALLTGDWFKDRMDAIARGDLQ